MYTIIDWNYSSLALAILSQEYLTPEMANERLGSVCVQPMKVKYRMPRIDPESLEVIADLRHQGKKWTEIAAICGIGKDAAWRRYQKWLKTGGTINVS